jgi:hypothetical protein
MACAPFLLAEALEWLTGEMAGEMACAPFLLVEALQCLACEMACELAGAMACATFLVEASQWWGFPSVTKSSVTKSLATALLEKSSVKE